MEVTLRLLYTVLGVVARVRYYIVFVSESLGGQRAVDWMATLIITCIQYRAIGQPLDPSDLLRSVKVNADIQQICFANLVAQVANWVRSRALHRMQT
jgi:hypothetical protein